VDEASKLKSYAIAYLDDIIIYSDTPESHLDTSITSLNSYISLVYGLVIIFLGHLIRYGEISIDPSKIEGIKHMPPPTDVKSLMRVLGVFLMKYSTPLTDLLRTKSQWVHVWGPAQNKAFQRLKARLGESPVLFQPEFGREFILERRCECLRNFGQQDWQCAPVQVSLVEFVLSI